MNLGHELAARLAMDLTVAMKPWLSSPFLMEGAERGAIGVFEVNYRKIREILNSAGPTAGIEVTHTAGDKVIRVKHFRVCTAHGRRDCPMGVCRIERGEGT